MKKCYHIKLCAHNFQNSGISKGFIANNYAVRECDWQQYRMKHGITKLREHLIKEVAQYKPDIIFCQIQNSEVLDIDTWKELQKHGVVVNFTFDVREKEEMKWYYEVSKHISLTCFACQEDVGWCKEYDGGKAIVLQSSADFDFYHKVEPRPDLYPEVVFIGNNYEGNNLNFPKAAERQRMIEALYDQFGDRFCAYGLGQKGKYLSPIEERQCYSTAKVTFTHNNFDRVGYCSDRFYRAAACRIAVVQQYYERMKVEFGMPTWVDIHDLKRYLHALSLNSGISTTGLTINQHVRQTHSYANRVKQLEQNINKNNDSGFMAWAKSENKGIEMSERIPQNL